MAENGMGGSHSDFEFVFRNDTNFTNGVIRYPGVFAGGLISLSLISVILNSVIVQISFHQKPFVKGEYRFFVANLAAIDICYSLTQLIGQPRYILGGTPADPYDIACQLNGFFEALTTICMITALSLVPFNRYMKVSHPNQYAKLFTPKKCVLICVLQHAVCIITHLAPLSLRFFGPDEYRRCLVRQYPAINPATQRAMNGFQLVILFLVVQSYFIIIYCNVIFFKKLKKVSISPTTTDEQMRRVQKNRTLMKATITQGLMPFVSFCPAIIGGIAFFGFGAKDTQGIGTVVNSLFFAANPVWDSLITLFMVKSYRKAIRYYSSYIVYFKYKWCTACVDEEDWKI